MGLSKRIEHRCRPVNFAACLHPLYYPRDELKAASMWHTFSGNGSHFISLTVYGAAVNSNKLTVFGMVYQ
jgi:hypothetical protein